MPGIASAATAVGLGLRWHANVDHPHRRGRDHASQPCAADHRRAVRHAGIAVPRPGRPGARTSAGHGPGGRLCAAPQPQRRREPVPQGRAGTAGLFQRRRTGECGPFPAKAWTSRSGSSGRACSAPSSRRCSACPTPSHPISRRRCWTRRSASIARRSSPSEQLDKPYVMLGFNAFVADSDEEAELLSTSIQQAFVALRTGQPTKLPPPQAGYAETLPLQSRAILRSVLSCSAIGNPDTARRQVEAVRRPLQAGRADGHGADLRPSGAPPVLRTAHGSGPPAPTRSRKVEIVMSKLFTPLEVGNLKLANRIVIAPMCQYSAEDGCMTDWHTIHLGHLALSGRGAADHRGDGASRRRGGSAMATRACGPTRPRRPWRRCWRACGAGRTCRSPSSSAMPGRKASTDKPWFGGAQIAPGQENGWQTVAPSPIPFAEGENPPQALDRAGLDRIRQAFADAAVRAARLGSRGRADPRGSRLSAAPVPVAALEPARPTNMAAAWKTACASRSRCSTRAGRLSGGPPGDRAPVRQRIGSRAAGTSNRRSSLQRRSKRAAARPSTFRAAGLHPRTEDPGRARATRCRLPARSSRRSTSPSWRSA